MASTLTSTFSVDKNAQPDGRKYVTEKHTNANGVNIVAEYLCASDCVPSDIMAARAAVIENMLAEQEAQAVIAGGG